MFTETTDNTATNTFTPTDTATTKSTTTRQKKTPTTWSAQLDKTDLHTVLGHAAAIAKPRNVMPVLGQVLVNTTNDQMTIYSTNLEITFKGTISANTAPNSFCVDAKLFKDIISKAPTESIQLTLEEGRRLLIRSGRSRMVLPTMLAEEFPSVTTPFPDEPGVVVPKHLLTRLMKTTSYATSKDESRYNIAGVLVDPVETLGAEQTVRMVATDGHRMAVNQIGVNGQLSSKAVIVPRAGVDAILKLLISSKQDECLAGTGSGFFVVAVENYTYSVRLVEATFPDYHQVTPSTYGTTASINVLDLKDTLSRVSLIPSDRNNSVKVVVTDNELVMSVKDSSGASAEEALSAITDGPPLTICLSCTFLTDAISAVNSEQVVLKFTTELGPVVIVDPDEPGLFSLIMPLRFD